MLLCIKGFVCFVVPGYFNLMFLIDLSRDSGDRFSLSRFMPKNERGEIDPLDSFFLDTLLGRTFESISVGGTYEVREEEFRPDLVSYKVYSDTQYWWIIMLFNGFIDRAEFKTGTLLNIPDQTGISDLVNRLKSIGVFVNG